jgi:hypothetical protein
LDKDCDMNAKIVSVPYGANSRVWYVVRNGSFIGGPFLIKGEAVAFVRSTR